MFKAAAASFSTANALQTVSPAWTARVSRAIRRIEASVRANSAATSCAETMGGSLGWEPRAGGWAPVVGVVRGAVVGEGADGRSGGVGGGLPPEGAGWP